MYQLKPLSWSSHLQLADRVPPQTRVLDVGCSSGYLGSLLQEKGCVVYGVDNDAAALKQAKGYRRIFLRDLDHEGPPPRERVDVIIFADTLEHLKRPDQVLRAYGRLLRPGGMILVSLPNIANLYIRGQLLLGKWEYQEQGILDRSHLRFFTRETARAFLQQAGFRIAWEGVTPIPLELVREPFRRPPALHLYRLLQACTQAWPSLLGFQFLFELRKR